jgi:putative transposase
MRRKVEISVGEYYHLYNRGTDKREIFTDTHDYNRFKALLYLCNSIAPVDISKHFSEGRSFAGLFEQDRDETLVDIIAYCLMPNHFHLLVREKCDGGTTKFLGKLSTGYSMYFNNKNKRTGALFEGRYKATHADSDEYLKYLLSYIHLNPIKIIDPHWKENGIKDQYSAQEYLDKYPYSSYFEWRGRARPETGIINKDASPVYFESSREFTHFINDWLTSEYR